MSAHRHWQFWRHEWQAVSARDRFAPFRDPLNGEVRFDCGYQKTDVLYRCACGAVKTKELRGKWTLDQVRG